MKDFTHELSYIIVSKANENYQYSYDEKVVITYGVELFLNFVLKGVIYIGIGFIFHKAMETVMCIFIFGVLRFFSGGKHASPFLFRLSREMYFTFGCIWTFIYGIFSKNQKHFGNSEKTNKIGLLIILNIIFGVGICISDYWRTIIMMIIIGQGVTLIERK